MRIIYITHYTSMYGANKSLLELVITMRDKYNIEPIIITPSFGEINNKLNALNIENYTYAFHSCVDSKDTFKVKSLLKYLRYKIINEIVVNKLSSKFMNFNISLIHTNSSCIDIGCELANRLGIKHIWHIREFGEEDYNLVYYIGVKKFFKYVESKSNKVIFISKALIDKYRMYFLDENAYCLIYNGIKKDDYYINIANKSFNSSFNIIFTGFICKEKNQFELLKAIDLVINKSALKNIKVYFLGDGDIEYITNMKNYCKEKCIDENIFFEGKVENVKSYIENAHIGIVSSFKEAFGRVTVEYMLGGLTVIASDTGANPEIITNGKDGMIYTLGNIKDLSNKIEYLYNNREKLKQMSFLSQQKAVNEYISDINCEKIHALYNEVLNLNAIEIIY